MTIHTVELSGCPPHVLANYLKTLAVMRLVATQKDEGARGQWVNGTFVLTSTLDREELCQFFLEQYQPTPLIAPWNGGSGFYPKDNREALNVIAAGAASRFAPFREAITVGRDVTQGRKERPEETEKLEMIRRARAAWPEALLPWLGAAVSLTDDGVQYPALLGTGGNDGRLDFTNNQMQRLVELFDPESGLAKAGARALLDAALFGSAVDGLQKRAIGQFLPGGAGGANATSGFTADSLVNLWDFVLAIEGTITFQVATLRRLDTARAVQAAAPLAVQGRAAGYASATIADEGNGRGEQWMPLWSGRATWSEVKKLFDEGRLFSSGSRATNSLQAAIGLSSMGAVRGVGEFERFGFVERNGQANLAVPLGRWRVQSTPAAQVVQVFEDWVERLRRAAERPGAPKGIAGAVRRIQTSMMSALHVGTAAHMTALLVQLAEAESATVRSGRWANEHRLQPLPTLNSRSLAEVLAKPTAAMRLAASISAFASKLGFGKQQYVAPIRWNCLPLEPPQRGNARFLETSDSFASTPREVWGGTLIDSLCSVLERRLIESGRTGAPVLRASAQTVMTVSHAEIAEFLGSARHDREIQRLARAFMCVEWVQPLTESSLSNSSDPSALYAALRLTYDGRPATRNRSVRPPTCSLARPWFRGARIRGCRTSNAGIRLHPRDRLKSTLRIAQSPRSAPYRSCASSPN
jgi:CRISPR-associated protein Csx17